MARLLLTAATLVLTTASATPPLGQTMNLPYAVALDLMLRCHAPIAVEHHRDLHGYMLLQYGETKAAVVVLSPVALAELYVNPQSSTWSIVRVSPEGRVCMAAIGVWPFGPEHLTS